MQRCAFLFALLIAGGNAISVEKQMVTEASLRAEAGRNFATEQGQFRPNDGQMAPPQMMTEEELRAEKASNQALDMAPAMSPYAVAGHFVEQQAAQQAATDPPAPESSQGEAPQVVNDLAESAKNAKSKPANAGNMEHLEEARIKSLKGGNEVDPAQKKENDDKLKAEVGKSDLPPEVLKAKLSPYVEPEKVEDPKAPTSAPKQEVSFYCNDTSPLCTNTGISTCCPGMFGRGAFCDPMDCEPGREPGSPCVGKWMAKYCRKTCKLCKRIPGVTQPPTPMRLYVVPNGDCAKAAGEVAVGDAAAAAAGALVPASQPCDKDGRPDQATQLRQQLNIEKQEQKDKLYYIPQPPVMTSTGAAAMSEKERKAAEEAKEKAEKAAKAAKEANGMIRAAQKKHGYPVTPEIVPKQ